MGEERSRWGGQTWWAQICGEGGKWELLRPLSATSLTPTSGGISHLSWKRLGRWNFEGLLKDVLNRLCNKTDCVLVTTSAGEPFWSYTLFIFFDSVTICESFSSLLSDSSKDKEMWFYPGDSTEHVCTTVWLLMAILDNTCDFTGWLVLFQKRPRSSPVYFW